MNVRIAIVGPAYPYKGGGARHTTELAHRLAAAGHDVIIESWHAQYPRRLYPGQQTVDVPEGEPYPRTRRGLAWYRPDGWLAAGRRLRDRRPGRLRPAHPRPGPRLPRRHEHPAPHENRRPSATTSCRTNAAPATSPLVRALLRRADTVITHSAAQAAQARTWPRPRRCGP